MNTTTAFSSKCVVWGVGLSNKNDVLKTLGWKEKIRVFEISGENVVSNQFSFTVWNVMEDSYSIRGSVYRSSGRIYRILCNYISSDVGWVDWVFVVVALLVIADVSCCPCLKSLDEVVFVSISCSDTFSSRSIFLRSLFFSFYMMYCENQNCNLPFRTSKAINISVRDFIWGSYKDKRKLHLVY